MIPWSKVNWFPGLKPKISLRQEFNVQWEKL